MPSNNRAPAARIVPTKKSKGRVDSEVKVREEKVDDAELCVICYGELKENVVSPILREDKKIEFVMERDVNTCIMKVVFSR